MRFEVEKRFVISAAHCLPAHPGRCSHLHGHNYEVVVRVRAGSVDAETGMLVDFGALKALGQRYDHALLNDQFEEPPTAENLAARLAREVLELAAGLAAPGAQSRAELRRAASQRGLSVSVTVFETPTSWAAAHLSWLDLFGRGRGASA